jgi:hypothetical protein
MLAIKQVQQYSSEVRLLYLLFIGWWLATYWGLIGFILKELNVPLGHSMLAKLPTIFSLVRH